MSATRRDVLTLLRVERVNDVVGTAAVALRSALRQAGELPADPGGELAGALEDVVRQVDALERGLRSWYEAERGRLEGEGAPWLPPGLTTRGRA